jgi:hypothetical protein
MPGGQHRQEPEARIGTWRVARETSMLLGVLPTSGCGTSGRCVTSGCGWVGLDAKAAVQRVARAGGQERARRRVPVRHAAV